MLTITIDHDELHREYYAFYAEDVEHIWLDEYYIMSRQTKRHKWVIDKGYSRLDQRKFWNNVIKIEETDVPLHDSIVRRLKDKLMETIHVAKWSER